MGAGYRGARLSTLAGGEAVVSGDDIADWDGASSLIQTAVDTFGGLDVLVNNAGFIRGSDLADTSVRPVPCRPSTVG